MNIGRRRHTDRRRGEDRAIPARHGISRPHVRIPDDPQRSSGYRTLGLGLALEVWAEGPVSGTERTSYAYRDDVDVTKVTSPRRQETRYEYERDTADGLKALRSQGNVREVLYDPGAAGSGVPRRERRRYDRRYNLASGPQVDVFGRTETVSLDGSGRSGPVPRC